jgi:hypothetical protein
VTKYFFFPFFFISKKCKPLFFFLFFQIHKFQKALKKKKKMSSSSSTTVRRSQRIRRARIVDSALIFGDNPLYHDEGDDDDDDEPPIKEPPFHEKTVVTTDVPIHSIDLKTQQQEMTRFFNKTRTMENYPPSEVLDPGGTFTVEERRTHIFEYMTQHHTAPCFSCLEYKLHFVSPCPKAPQHTICWDCYMKLFVSMRTIGFHRMMTEGENKYTDSYVSGKLKCWCDPKQDEQCDYKLKKEFRIPNLTEIMDISETPGALFAHNQIPCPWCRRLLPMYQGPNDYELSAMDVIAWRLSNYYQKRIDQCCADVKMVRGNPAYVCHLPPCNGKMVCAYTYQKKAEHYGKYHLSIPCAVCNQRVSLPTALTTRTMDSFMNHCRISMNHHWFGGECKGMVSPKFSPGVRLSMHIVHRPFYPILRFQSILTLYTSNLFGFLWHQLGKDSDPNVDLIKSNMFQTLAGLVSMSMYDLKNYPSDSRVHYRSTSPRRLLDNGYKIVREPNYFKSRSCW